MRRPFLSIVLLLTAPPASAESSFTGNFELRRPDTNGAVVRGVIAYDVARHRLRYDYVDRLFHEIRRYDDPGFGPPPVPRVNQRRYEVGVRCDGGCRAHPIADAFPIYVNDPVIYAPTGAPPVTIAGLTCTEVAPRAGVDTPLVRLWFAADVICRARWADGAEYTFDTVVPADLSDSAVFTEPVDCRGTDRLDLLVLVDRSASITNAAYDQAREIIAELARRLRVAPSEANVAIAHFDVGVEPIMSFSEGTSLPSIDAAAGAMDCACTDTLDPALLPEEVPPGTPACCARRTSIAAALDAASNLLASSGRPDASPTSLTRKAIVVVSDGVTTTLRDGVTPCKVSACKKDVKRALADLKQAHHSIEVYGAAIGPRRGGSVLKLMKPVAKLASNAPRCPAADVCDPTTCGGLCECAECTAPSACDPSGLYCKINTIVPGGTTCELVDRICAAEYPNHCENRSCDEATASCEPEPTVCLPPTHPSCMVRQCVAATGQCVTQIYPDGPCGDDCALDADCDDGNACTVDRCIQTDTYKVCQFIPRTCDDGDPCTEDFCLSPSRGCESRPRPSTFCDDGISCTDDVCVPFLGCTNVPRPCDDGLTCTTDVCDVVTGHCVNRDATCPEGTTALLGACWTLTPFNVASGIAGAPTDCKTTCKSMGLRYDVATRAVAGSGGTDANCAAVLQALGASAGGLDAPSADCRSDRGGSGCFIDSIFLPGGFPGTGRCAKPATSPKATDGFQRVACACR
ncbi:VWA domain-containing protein [bacterium]|nr:VWA domain-containing protein [bacterium]